MFNISDNKLDATSFIELSSQYGEYKNTLKTGTEVKINLSCVELSEPFGVVGLIIFTRFLYNEHRINSTIIMPQNQSAKNYLLLAGIKKDENKITKFEGVDNERLSDKFMDYLSGYYAKRVNMNFLPISDIIDINDIDRITNSVDQWMLNNNYIDEERYDIQVLISELCQNIKHHSYTKQYGLFFMQGYDYRKIGGPKRCIVSIGDTGVGIKNSLFENPEYAHLLISDAYAIDNALINGWSSKENNRFRGNGFTNLLRLSQKHNANVYIHSHGGYVNYNFSKSDNYARMRRIIKNLIPINGTQICFELEAKE